MKNEQMIIEEARRYMGHGENIREDKPIIGNQKRDEAGRKKSIDEVGRKKVFDIFCLLCYSIKAVE